MSSHVTVPQRISAIANQLGLGEDDYEPLGWHKAKLALGLEQRLARPAGKYVTVTATSPTPLGEGKTITSIGLAMGLQRIGERALVALRQPSQGPLFGIKGGGAGDHRAALLPRDDINLHFTGDAHAVTAATNLLAAMLDNHVLRGLAPHVERSTITWQRAIDVCDRSLRRVSTQSSLNGRVVRHETAFRLTPASEVMAILALATNLTDLRRRLGRIVVGRTSTGAVVTAEELRAAGAMAALLRDALRPNLVQTCEHTPAFVHAGPFANIAPGNSSVIADLIGTRLADYVITESGFGADCGAEKFFHIKCRASQLEPDAVVLVTTVRALKMQSGQWTMRPGRSLPRELASPDLASLRRGIDNLAAHLQLLGHFGTPVVVAINRFPTDAQDELREIERFSLDHGAARVAVSEAFARGGEGAEELARAVQDVCRPPRRPPRMLYSLDMPTEEKIRAIATQVYGADGVEFSDEARRQLDDLRQVAPNDLPVCIAKTPYSLSHDPARLGRPRGFQLLVRGIHWSAGAGFLYALAGDVSTMPGLPARPAARDVDVTGDGQIVGLR